MRPSELKPRIRQLMLKRPQIQLSQRQVMNQVPRAREHFRRHLVEFDAVLLLEPGCSVEQAIQFGIEFFEVQFELSREAPR